MMLLKIISLSLISCLYLQNFVVPLNQCIYKNDKYIEVSDKTQYEFEGEQYEFKGEQYELVASVPNKNIKLYAIESCNYPGEYNKFLLSINETKGIFRWRSLSFKVRPQLILSDVDNDNVEELIVILTTKSGTGFHEQEIHVINNIEGFFYEYLITNPLIIIKENVTSQITQREEDVLIQLKLNDKEYKYIKNKDYSPIWFDKVYFGNIIRWEVTDNKLFVRVPGQISAVGFIGDLVIQYKFNPENEFFNLDKITYEEKKMPPENLN